MMQYYIEEQTKMFTYASGTEIPIVNVYGPFDSVTSACDKIAQLGLSDKSINENNCIIKCYNNW